MSEITHGIMDATVVKFGTINEGIIKLLEDRLGPFTLRLQLVS